MNLCRLQEHTYGTLSWWKRWHFCRLHVFLLVVDLVRSLVTKNRQTKTMGWVVPVYLPPSLATDPCCCPYPQGLLPPREQITSPAHTWYSALYLMPNYIHFRTGPKVEGSKPHSLGRLLVLILKFISVCQVSTTYLFIDLFVQILHLRSVVSLSFYTTSYSSNFLFYQRRNMPLNGPKICLHFLYLFISFWCLY